jgi:hypothetical protein
MFVVPHEKELCFPDRQGIEFARICAFGTDEKIIAEVSNTFFETLKNRLFWPD